VNPNIRFFSEDIDFALKNRVKVRLWLTGVIKKESKLPGAINIIFCNDTYLLHLNNSYLGHNTLTDIITFPFPDKTDKISGDIYISLERVGENSIKFNQLFDDELLRVMVHGVLHLLGYKDKSKKDKTAMRSKEDFYLNKQNI
jgi:rRNA maturation RNase YbeY